MYLDIDLEISKYDRIKEAKNQSKKSRQYVEDHPGS